jgi:hypothetical protein
MTDIKQICVNKSETLRDFLEFRVLKVLKVAKATSYEVRLTMTFFPFVYSVITTYNTLLVINYI